MKKACLVLLAHGSPDPRWREPFERLAASLGAEFGPERVKLAYLEYTSPTLEEAAGEAACAGRGRLYILPLFMSGGGHVSHDVPRLAASLAWKFPEVEIVILPAAGEHPKVVAALHEIVAEVLG